MKHLLMLTLLLCMTFSYALEYASHYDIADIDIVPASVQSKVLADGIDTTEILLSRLMTPSDRKSFATRFSMDLDAVNKLAHKLELMQIIGVGPKAADLLLLAGVKNIKGLAAADPNTLLEALLAANREHAITGVQPDMTVVKDWIARAQKITNHLS